jgi:hypothetical protein
VFVHRLPAAGLILNLYTFPIPPADQRLPDVGPAVGLFYVAIIIQLIRFREWFRTPSDER